MKFNNLATAQYGAVSQLLALVQWRAWAHAFVTTAIIDLRLLPVIVTEWLQVPCPDSCRQGTDSWLTGWLTYLDCLKLAITRWPTWAVQVRVSTCSDSMPVWCFNLNLKYQVAEATWTALPADSLLWQHPLQQVHARDQVCHSSAEHSPQFVGCGEARGAPKLHQIAAQVKWYQINRWYKRAMISEVFDIMGTYHARS